MTAKEKTFAVHWLRVASERFSQHICNDMNFPADWTTAEREDFTRRYHEWNGDPQEFSPAFLFLPDFAAMDFLAHLLEEETKE